MRFQSKRAAKKGQLFGTRIEIHTLDEASFYQYLSPRLQHGFVKEFNDYLAFRDHEMCCMMMFDDIRSRWQVVGVGLQTDLIQLIEGSGWALRVMNFTCPEALAHGAKCGDDLIDDA